MILSIQNLITMITYDNKFMLFFSIQCHANITKSQIDTTQTQPYVYKKDVVEF